MLTLLSHLPHSLFRCQVCVELENHIGMADKDLAEFVIHLALESDGAPSFKTALASNGAIFPAAFAERLYEMVV
jgi:ATP-dependent RNA helicase DHX8/PRP22